MAVDCPKLNANASRLRAMSYERMLKAEAELKEQVNGLLNQWDGRPPPVTASVCQSRGAILPLKPREASTTKITTVGIDLAKTCFKFMRSMNTARRS